MAAVKTCNILITGANRGLGLEMVKQLSESSCPKWHIFATCRDPDRPKSEAPLESEESLEGIPRVISSLTEKQHSALDYTGETIPW